MIFAIFNKFGELTKHIQRSDQNKYNILGLLIKFHHFLKIEQEPPSKVTGYFVSKIWVSYRRGRLGDCRQ
jgi:hypothetical protein